MAEGREKEREGGRRGRRRREEGIRVRNSNTCTKKVFLTKYIATSELNNLYVEYI